MDFNIKNMQTKNLLLLVLFTISLFSNACKNATPKTNKENTTELFKLFEEDPNAKPFYSDRKGVIASKGMVASAHPIASAVGVEILKAGGNAFDAAIATHFALAVAFPFAGNIGGGGFAVVRTKSGEKLSLDFRETAPEKASRDMYLDKDGNVISGLSTKGHLASGVPGSVDGMVELHKKLGKLPWEKLLEPAIKLASQGLALTEREVMGLNNNKGIFKEVNGADCPYFMQAAGLPWKKDEQLIQKDLGEVLKLIQKNKRAGFYEGPVADLLVQEMKAHGGIITQNDLSKYTSVWRKPLLGEYRGHTIITMPPSSSGGIALLQLLGFTEKYPLNALGWHSEKATQVMIEAERRVYADRAKWLGDMDFVKVPLVELTSKKYLESRWAAVNLDKATPSEAIVGGSFPGFESDETTHFSVVDAEGNAIAITTTLNGAYGSKVIVKGGGFLMNNEMDDFSVKAGVPNMFGLVGNKQNEIQPGKRMLSSMTPTIVEKNGKLFFTVGTPGGSTIITSVYQTIVNVIDHKMDMQQAVNALKFHHQWKPDKIFFEKNAFSEKVLNGLKGKAYNMEEQKSTLGRMDCIMLKPDGTLEGASDPRADNTSVGY
jgi:gamma-glutamyltranspeptidase / glutathione hydrolase